MTQLREFLRMSKKKARYDFRGKEVKETIKEINKETDGIERQGTDCFAGLLYGNREEGENDTLESSL